MIFRSISSYIFKYFNKTFFPESFLRKIHPINKINMYIYIYIYICISLK